MMLTSMRTLEDLFRELLARRDRDADLPQLGPWLAQQMPHCVFPALHQLPLQAKAYTRNLIAREQAPTQQAQIQPTQIQQRFEALILRWDRQAQTRIHGHPAFSFYHVISGRFAMEYFAQTRHGLQCVDIRAYQAGGTTWFLGYNDRYDNFIHRVTCLEPGLTFHVYSDNAQKGCCWETMLNQAAQSR
ncbi:MAG: hypothetical protein AAGG51_13720 [Cyanobacteria bacterium P01_G01_bin.54]